LLRVVVLVSCLFLLSGCAVVGTHNAYEGKFAYPDDLALIVCDSDKEHSFLKGLDERLFIVAIDGESTHSFVTELTANQGYPESAYVLPGQRVIDVKYEHKGKYAFGRLTVDIGAGESMIVRKETVGPKVSFWLEPLKEL
jgi:uncharacterized protein YceK